jgi:hypothetical protein
VKFELDENIGRKAEQLQRDVGYDVSTLRLQSLNGTTDESLFEVCIAEQRALVTLDQDFGQVLRFPPGHSSGIVILEVAPRAGARAVESRIPDLIALLSGRELRAELWIIEPGRVRIHQRLRQGEAAGARCQALRWRRHGWHGWHGRHGDVSHSACTFIDRTKSLGGKLPGLFCLVAFSVLARTPVR